MTKSTITTEIRADLQGVIIAPRITEKAAYGGSVRMYTFDVNPTANKTQIARAIKAIYGVVPAEVNTIVSKAKNVFVRGRWGKTTKTKKAMVFLREGDSIELA
jgi:large subunit ribosomal protein L23